MKQLHSKLIALFELAKQLRFDSNAQKYKRVHLRQIGLGTVDAVATAVDARKKNEPTKTQVNIKTFYNPSKMFHK